MEGEYCIGIKAAVKPVATAPAFSAIPRVGTNKLATEPVIVLLCAIEVTPVKVPPIAKVVMPETGPDITGRTTEPLGFIEKALFPVELSTEPLSIMSPLRIRAPVPAVSGLMLILVITNLAVVTGVNMSCPAVAALIYIV